MPGPLPRTFRSRLALIALGALALRVAYAIAHRGAGIQGDALTFWLDAAHLADGHGFRRAFEDVPTAEHPPLHIVLLAVQHLAGIHGYEDQKLLLCLVGTLTVVVLGLVGREVGGDRAGLAAAGLAALYPNLWTIDASLMSETPYALAIATVVLVALRVRTARGAAGLGALVALATLTRGEALGLVLLLLVPVCWRRPRWLAVAVVAFVLVLAPWTVRNLRTFEEPVIVSDNGYGVVIGANCHESYYGGLVGSWAYECFRGRAPGDESQYSVDYRDRGLRYARDHLGRLPVVVAARAGRMLELYPAQSAFFQESEGRSSKAAWAGIVWFWLMLPLSAYGMVLLRRRGGSGSAGSDPGVARRALLVLLAPVALSVVVCLGVYGSTRLRVAAEPALIVLAALALVQAASRRGRVWGG
jgi:4-amino-4-deoxy-L-arabinose transferase-like glycosyltransferase